MSKPRADAKRRILFAEDHLVVYQGISRMLAREYEFIGPITDGGEVIDAIEDSEPDLILLDLDLPTRSGSDLLPELRSRFEAVPVLVLTVQTSPEVMEEVIRLGARGFIPKGAGVAELRAAIQDCLAGRVHRSPRVVRQPWQRRSHPHDEVIVKSEDLRRQIFRLIGEGHKTKGIAKLIGMTQWTVYYHRRALRKLLNITSERGLDRAAMDWAIRQLADTEAQEDGGPAEVQETNPPPQDPDPYGALKRLRS